MRKTRSQRSATTTASCRSFIPFPFSFVAESRAKAEAPTAFFITSVKSFQIGLIGDAAAHTDPGLPGCRRHRLREPLSVAVLRVEEEQVGLTAFLQMRQHRPGLLERGEAEGVEERLIGDPLLAEIEDGGGFRRDCDGHGVSLLARQGPQEPDDAAVRGRREELFSRPLRLAAGIHPAQDRGSLLALLPRLLERHLRARQDGEAEIPELSVQRKDPYDLRARGDDPLAGRAAPPPSCPRGRPRAAAFSSANAPIPVNPFLERLLPPASGTDGPLPRHPPPSPPLPGARGYR